MRIQIFYNNFFLLMFKIYNNLQTFDPAHSFKAWIYQISRNHCLDFLKSRAGRLLDASEIQGKDIPDSDSPERIVMKIEIQAKNRPDHKFPEFPG